MISPIKRTSSAVTSRFTPCLGPSETRWWIRHGLIIRSFYAHKSKAITVCLCASILMLPTATISHPVLGFLDSRIERPSTIYRADIFVLHPRLFQSLSRSVSRTVTRSHTIIRCGRLVVGQIWDYAVLRSPISEIWEKSHRSSSCHSES